MLETLATSLHLILSTIGLVVAPESGALGLTVAVVTALLAAALAAAVASPDAARRTGAHPRRGIDASSLLAQSDPDAAGHPRPRAPGSAVPAA